MIYILGMCIYPSGKIHMGHARVYTIGQALKNYFKYISQDEVIFPIGWDSFGLPAEALAIKTATDPKLLTQENIENIRKEFQLLKINFDWEYEINTSDEKYYALTQKLIWELFDAGLLYQSLKELPYCQNCHTVLANEQSINMICWRCNNQVILKETKQWFLAITKFAESLYQDIELLQYWPKNVLQMQKKWLGYYQNNFWSEDEKKFFLIKNIAEIPAGKSKFVSNQENFFLDLEYVKKNCSVVNEQKTFVHNIHDWCISRQRYWGVPLPLSNCPNCGWFKGDINWYKLPSWETGFDLAYQKVTCPQCHTEALKSSDTLDTFLDSSWYFYRHLNPNGETFFENKNISVDYYIGGKEHAVSHLIYARFIHKFFYQKEMLEKKEPFDKLITCGTILNKTKFCSQCNFYVNYKLDKCHICLSDLKVSVEKMSKSKLNGLSPLEMMETFSDDAIKLYILFVAPIEKDIYWDDQGIIGMQKFINRIKEFTDKVVFSEKKEKILHLKIKKIKDNFQKKIDQGRYEFNVLIAELISFFYLLKETKDSLLLEKFLYLLAIVAENAAQYCFENKFQKKMTKISFFEEETISYEIKILHNQKFLGKLNFMQKPDNNLLIQNICERFPGLTKKKFYISEDAVNFLD